MSKSLSASIRRGNRAMLESLEGRKLLSAVVSAAHPTLTAVADISGDRRADAVTVEPVATGTNGDFRVTLSMGDGRGGFTSQLTHELDLLSPIAVMAGRAGSEQLATSVIVDRFAGTPTGWLMAYTSVIEGGQILTWQTLLPNSAFFGAEAGSWAYGNVNNDPFMDLVRLDDTGMISVFAGGWGFNFQDPTFAFTFWGNNARQLTLGDFDHDGWDDMAAITDQGVQVALAIGGNPCAPPTTLDLNGATARSITAADLNRDGYDDLAISTADGNILSFIQRKDGTFASPLVSHRAAHTTATAMHAADADADGDNDLLLAAAPGGAGTMLLAVNNGAGRFTQAGFGKVRNANHPEIDIPLTDPRSVL